MEDETMSQEIAFADVKQEETFKFDTAEPTTPASQAETVKTESDSPSVEDKETVVVEDDTEQKIPYSRFKKKMDELNETNSKMQMLEDRLKELETARIESQSDEDITPDAEWTKLYGNSDVAKEAYKIQIKRDEAIAERAVKQAIDRIRESQIEETTRLSENEEKIDDNLSQLQTKLGKKLSSKQEEDILSIVDEFSPTGQDGKYVSLFPFDKAYEIYEMRQAKKGAPIRQAREAVADLTSNNSSGEAPASGVNGLGRGWDGWRAEL